ncbi:MAG TPA: phosphoribosylamine--glycine ligase [Bellilinea sp.]|nr:phosphoribosylamine--glycine ligase [Bellilinea sp.]
MEILIVGNGGREHAIAWALARNDAVSRVYFSTHNGGAGGKLVNAELAGNDFASIAAFLDAHPVDLVVIGPEKPLSEGLADRLQERGVKVFGPGKSAARLESSKAFAKEFMLKYDIPTAKYERFDDFDEAKAALGRFGCPVVIKADGLCAGKGVIICQNEAEAVTALQEILVDRVFGSEGANVIMEQYLRGFEASLLCFVSGSKVYPCDTAMDYKKIYDGDLGPNTGGVGCISPNPYWTPKLDAKSDAVLRKIEHGLAAEGLGYNGILFIGYMVQDGEPYVLEFNTRFGDPETEVLLPRLSTDLLTNIQQAVNGEPVELAFDENVCVATVLVSEGYPKEYEIGFDVSGLEEVSAGTLVFHNGTILKDGVVLTNGGRVLSVAACAATLDEVREHVYAEAAKIRYTNKGHRTDIGLLR